MKRLSIPYDFFQIIETLDIYSDNCRTHLAFRDDRPVVLDVTGLYKWLGRNAENRGSRIFCDTKFQSTHKNDSGQYVSTVRSRTGLRTIVSNYIVDASGVQCAVLRSLSLEPKPARYGVGLEYEYALGDNALDRAVLFVGTDALSGYGWIFPTSDHRFRVGVGVIHPDTDLSPKEMLEGFLKSDALKRYGITVAGEVLQKNGGTIPSIPYDPKLVHGQVIRVGDTANFATPIVGEGIRICIEFGALLGRQLGKTLQTGNRNHLSEYEATCQRTMARNYQVGVSANKRIASYGVADWDKSVARLGRLKERDVVALLKAEFSAKLVLRTFLGFLRGRIERYLKRLGVRRA
jgi:flavin-dependent dehydrogenase